MKKNIGFKIPEELHEWYITESERTGVSMASMMTTALNQYKDNEEMKIAVKNGNLTNLLNELNNQIGIATANLNRDKIIS